MESTSVSRLRGLAAPLRLARARIAARPGRGLLAALGVAAAVAMLAATPPGGGSPPSARSTGRSTGCPRVSAR